MTRLPKDWPHDGSNGGNREGSVHPALQARTARYQELMALELPMLFPHGVDQALDSTEPVSELVRSEAYIERCREEHTGYAELYRSNEWTPQVIARGVLPDRTLLIDLFCEGWLRHFCPNGYRDWEEKLAQLRYNVILHAHQYVAGKMSGKTFKPFKYGASLWVYAFRQATRERVRERQRSGLMLSLEQVQEQFGEDSPLGGTVTFQPSDEMDEHQLRDALVPVLRDFPWTGKSRETARQVAFTCRTLREAGRSQRIWHTTVARMLAPLSEALLDRMRSHARKNKLTPSDALAVISLVGRLFSVEQFDAITTAQTAD